MARHAAHAMLLQLFLMFCSAIYGPLTWRIRQPPPSRAGLTQAGNLRMGIDHANVFPRGLGDQQATLFVPSKRPRTAGPSFPLRGALPLAAGRPGSPFFSMVWPK